jgi:hypothetical protein
LSFLLLSLFVVARECRNILRVAQDVGHALPVSIDAAEVAERRLLAPVERFMRITLSDFSASFTRASGSRKNALSASGVITSRSLPQSVKAAQGFFKWPAPVERL